MSSSLNTRLHSVAPLQPDTVDAAIWVLQDWDRAGRLEYPQPWTNAAGVTVTAWTAEDGPVLACYMNMLGLDGVQTPAV